ncbi:hypothetical protein N8D55_13170 [Xanthomonas hortorum pv. pelargonii]|nr:hypothetical protein N8D55_13170 [Xanthomonas hortorum pv. pelargonii]
MLALERRIRLHTIGLEQRVAFFEVEQRARGDRDGQEPGELSVIVGPGFGIWDLGFGIWDLGFGIWDLGFGIGLKQEP